MLARLEDARYGFYESHEPSRQTVFLGWHGGAMQMGVALDPRRGMHFVAVSHVSSSFTITRAAQHSSPAVADLDPAYSCGCFFSVLINRLRVMPAVTAEDMDALYGPVVLGKGLEPVEAGCDPGPLGNAANSPF